MSDTVRFSAWDYVIFILMLVISVGIGLFHGCGGKQKTVQDFLMGNRKMQILPVALSMLASFMSAVTVLGVPAENYLFGCQFMLISIAYALLVPVVAFIYIPVFYNLKLTSMYEYLEIRFRKAGVKLIGSITFIVQMNLYMAIALYAPCLALNAVTGLNLWLSVFTVGIVCTFYTTLGGMKAVMWTDVFQISMMILGILIVLIKGSMAVGGMSNVWKIAQEGDRIELFNFDLDPRTRNTVWTSIVGGFFQWIVIYAGNQSQVQRALACPSLRNAQIAMLINGPGLIVLNVMTSLCGLVCYAYYRHCDPLNNGQIMASDQILPLFVMEVVNIPGIPGMFVACVFSAALSSISSGLNSLAAVTMQDIVLAKFAPNMRERNATICAKLLALGYGVLMMVLAVIASQLGGVLQAAFSIFGMTGGPLMGLICLGLFFPNANWIGGVIGWFVSLLFQCWIVIGANIVKPAIPQPDRSTKGCNEFNSSYAANVSDYHQYYTTASIYPQNVSAMPEPLEERVMFYEMYCVSYLWYPLIGILLTIIVGLPISYITGGENPEDVDSRAIVPLCEKLCCCLPISCRKYFPCSSLDSDDDENDFIYTKSWPTKRQGNGDVNVDHQTGEPLMLSMRTSNSAKL